ncbi:MAG: hypothetical protein ACFE95_07660 [Candidatus Hodarchaeota archaeon]
MLYNQSLNSYYFKSEWKENYTANLIQIDLMLLDVEIKDHNGVVTNRDIEMPYLAFLKHMAIAGQGYFPTLRSPPFIRKYHRFFSMRQRYKEYIDRNTYQNSAFSEPSSIFSNPSEKAEFSRIAGYAIADYLTRRIDGALISFNYEAVLKILRIPISRRPDLLCYNPDGPFSVETKGLERRSVNSTDMKEHKKQAKSGPYPVNFFIASVAYSLYNNVKVKYHDPKNEDFNNDQDLLTRISKRYYQEIKQLLESGLFEIDLKYINNREYFSLSFKKSIHSGILFKNHIMVPLFPIKYDAFLDRFSILIDKICLKYAKKGIEDFELKPYYSKEKIYIDSDGIGLMLK